MTEEHQANLREAEARHAQNILRVKSLETQACGYLETMSKLISLGVPKETWSEMWAKCIDLLGENNNEYSGLLQDARRATLRSAETLDYLKKQVVGTG